jgi:YVTN family beta-propeller protein
MEKQEVVKKLATGKRPDILTAVLGYKLFLTHRADNNVAVINLTTGQMESTINTGLEPHGIAVKP